MATLNLADNLNALQKIQAASKTGARLMVISSDQAVELPISILAEALSSALSTDTLGAQDAVSLLGQVPSFAGLRALKPRVEGARVSLRGWNAGSCFGAGDFIGHLVTATQKQQADDGGVIAAGSGYYWERVLDNPAVLNVTHFGAVPDGVTDAVPAMQAMHKYTLAKNTGLGIQFPSGKFFVSRFVLDKELSYFRMAGNHVNYGYFTHTVIVTDANENYLIDVNARWVELANIQFLGTSVAATPNKKGVFNNVITGGQFFNGSCLRFSQIGGTCINMVDMLDTKISQWYASGCMGDVIAGRWSDRKEGGWNHTTAVELTNFNVQNCVGGQVLNLPRCTQSMIHNGWIEHCDNPGDISNGQWVITALSIEACSNPLKASYSRVIELQRNLQSGSAIDYTPGPGDVEWLSEWERGRIDVQNHGLFVDGSTEPGTIMSRNKLSNTTDTARWYRVGYFYTPDEGDSIEINMVGTGNYLSTGARLDDIDGVRQGGGNTLIRAQYKKGGYGLTMMPSGSSPLLAAKMVKGSANQMILYVQLKPYTRNVIPVLTATGKTHFESGISYYFRPDIAQISDTDIGKLKDVTDIAEQWSIGRNAGMGATIEGNLLLKGQIVNDHLAVQVNLGTEKNPKVQVRYLQLKTEAK